VPAAATGHNALAHVPIAAADDRRRAGLVELLSDNPTIGSSARHRPEARQSSERAGARQVPANSAPATVSRRCEPAVEAPRPGPGGRARSPGLDRLSAARGWRRHRARLCAPSTLATDNVVWTPATGLDDYPAALDWLPTILKPSPRRDGDWGGPGTLPVLTLRDGMTSSRAAGAAHDALPRHRRWARARQILSTIERLRIDPRLDRASR